MTKSFVEILGQDIKTLSSIGVYKIYHKKKPERLYIGSTSKYKSARKFAHHGFYRRWYEHYRLLSLGIHSSKYLQNTVNKYGIEDLVFEIVEICDGRSVTEVREREQFHIDTLKPVYNCFNTVHPQGRKWTKKQKQARSRERRGVPLPNPAYEKIRKPVYQMTNKGVILFTSIEEAAKHTKIDRASISKCASGIRSTAGGYKWCWKI